MKKIIVSVLAALFVTAAPLKAALGFEARSNDDLRKALMLELKMAQAEFVGEPFYYQIQDLRLQIELSQSNGAYSWLNIVHEWCDQMIAIYPPRPYHAADLRRDRIASIRKQILRIRDYPIHEVSQQNSGAEFYTQAMADAFYEATYGSNVTHLNDILTMLGKPVPEGVCQVIKVYSSGFIFRTSEACIGIDVVYKRCFNTNNRMDEIANALDVLFTTHPHTDHYDINLWQKALNAGVNMVFAHDKLPSVSGKKYKLMATDSNGFVITDETDINAYSKIKGTVKHQPLTLDNGTLVDVHAIASKQGSDALILCHAKFGDWTFYHVSDSDDHATWTSNEVKQLDAPDFMFVPHAVKELQGYAVTMMNPTGKPMFYLTTHENEFEHTVSSRCAYSYMLTHAGILGGQSTDYSCFFILMDVGESLYFTK